MSMNILLLLFGLYLWNGQMVKAVNHRPGCEGIDVVYRIWRWFYVVAVSWIAVALVVWFFS
jgi:hypothetical protein